MTEYPINPTIDHDYNARESVPSFEAAYGALVELSNTARDTLPFAPDLEFDPSSGMTLDLYGQGTGRPVFLWIHGGYWRLGTKEENAFAAPGLVAHDIAVAVMDYSLAPAATLNDIVHQVRTAVTWLHTEGPALGLDTRRIHVGGSSAGGQLVGTVLASGWQQRYSLPSDPIGAALALSGIYDLEPLLHTQVNGWMGMDMQTVADLSPIRHIPSVSDADLILSVGGMERSGFLRETEAFATAWTTAGHRCKTVAMLQYDHFNIAGTLSDPKGTLVQETARAIKGFHT